MRQKADHVSQDAGSIWDIMRSPLSEAEIHSLPVPDRAMSSLPVMNTPRPTATSAMQTAIIECLRIYGLAAIISVAIAATIKLIVIFLTHQGRNDL